MDICFPLADGYARILGHHDGLTAHEPSARYRTAFHWSERHLQCIWFDSRYRPKAFPLAGGETLTVIEPGEWNLEAGPDFINATLLIQPGARRIRGDIEVHVRPADWDAHRHGADPAYANVIAHVTWFAGPAAKTLPSAVCPLPLAEPLAARADLSLDDIDLKAYPHAALPETPRPCSVFLKDDPARAKETLRMAGHHRLREKAARILARLNQSGDRQQVFYEEVMAALGYKNNQPPFRALARLVPAAALREASREGAFAALLGASRLLPQPDAAPDAEGKRFIRALWDTWWKQSGDTLPEDTPWCLHNIRPHNSPVRRLAAAAALFSDTHDLLGDTGRLMANHPDAWFRYVAEHLENACEWDFWNQRLAFSSAPDASRNHALLGDNRTAAILVNVILPFAAAEGSHTHCAVNHLPPEDISAPMRLTALHLFGRDHNPAALYADNGLLQQGLLQIHTDFCLNAQPDCAGCRLCAALAE
ncbi:MAG: DUF2851 family protein [Kiritimatiellaeota bacterium]|nr:DUF2851 family protein [Kiritimatiellota bacterium]